MAPGESKYEFIDVFFRGTFCFHTLHWRDFEDFFPNQFDFQATEIILRL